MHLQKKDVARVYSYPEVIALYKNIGFWQVEKEIVDKYFQKNTRLNILDAGCGAGRTSIEFAKMNTRTFGMDISIDILKAVQKETHTIHNLHFINSDLTQLPFKPLALDAIVAFGSTLGLIINRTERKEIIKQFSKVLKQNGVLAFNVHNLLYPGFLGKRWIKWILIEIKKILSRQNIEFGTRKVNETGQELFCHYFHFYEIKNLIKPYFKLIEIIPAKGRWETNTHTSTLFFCEDFYVICTKL